DIDHLEVVISEPQVRLFTAMFSNSALTQTARAVAEVGSNGNGCVVTLDRTNVDVFDNGNTQLNTTACDLYINSNACDALDQSGGNTSVHVDGNIYVVAQAGCNGVSGSNVTGNIIPHVLPINDPYANVPPPGSHDSTCSSTSA